MPRKFQQKSKQARHLREGSSEHAAFRLALGWLWEKHVQFSPGVRQPEHVAQALAPCDGCRNGPACPYMATLWGAERQKKPAETPEPTSTGHGEEQNADSDFSSDCVTADTDDNADPPLWCEICEHDTHDKTRCPLVWSCACGTTEDVRRAERPPAEPPGHYSV